MGIARQPYRSHENRQCRQARSIRWLTTQLLAMFSPPRKFCAPEVELAYLRDHGQRFAGSRSAAFFLACVTWSVFVILDLYHGTTNEAFRETLPQMLLIRLAGSTMLCAFACYAIPRIEDESCIHAPVISAVVLSSVLILVSVVTAPSTHGYTYYFPGLYLIEFFHFGLFNLRAKPSIATSCVMIAMVCLLQAAVHPLQNGEFIVGTFFLIMIAMCGLASNVITERHSRDRFAAELAMRDANEKLGIVNTDLVKKQASLEKAQAARLAATDALLSLRARKQEEAEQQNRAKSVFLAAAAHDLRQPMHALNLFLHAAQQSLRRGDSMEAQVLTEQASEAGNVMSNLFNSILELSRLEAGGVVPEYQQLELTSVIRTVVLQLDEHAKTNGVRLRVRAPPSTVYVISDPHWLGRVLMNLVENGIKYHAARNLPPSTVILGVVRLGTRARVDIIDNGIGIAPECLRKIFRPFYQIGNAERSRDKGIGLGLSIVNAAISMLKEHRIEVTSKPGIGSRFSIDVPMSSVPSFDAEQSLGRSDNGDQSMSGRYILLVEDDPLARASTIALLNQWGALVEAVPDLDALDELLTEMERTPDLLILDYRLPGQHTYADALSLIKQHLGSHVPYLIVTGETTTLPPVHGTSGCALMKPVNPDRLLAAIAKALPR